MFLQDKPINQCKPSIFLADARCPDVVVEYFLFVCWYLGCLGRKSGFWRRKFEEVMGDVYYLKFLLLSINMGNSYKFMGYLFLGTFSYSYYPTKEVFGRPGHVVTSMVPWSHGPEVTCGWSDDCSLVEDHGPPGPPLVWSMVWEIIFNDV